MTTELNIPSRPPIAGLDAAAPADAAAAAAAAPATVAAESDARTVNSTDAGGNVMRHAYRVLSDEEKKMMVELKDAGLALWQKIHALEEAGSREISIAKTKCQEAVMWAVSHLTK
jgi:hypothetical protein